MVYGTVLKFLLDVGYDETSNPGAHVSPSFRSEIVDINNGILKTRDPECQIVFCIKKFKLCMINRNKLIVSSLK